MIWDEEATVKGEIGLEGAAPTHCAISKGRVAVLSERSGDLSERILQVFDKNGRPVYELTLDADHPISREGETLELAFGGDVLYLRTPARLFRLSANGKDLTVSDVSRDAMRILPVDEGEVLVCTPAYAARLETQDFGKIE